MKKLMTLAAAMTALAAAATDYTWSGASGGSWTDEANWGGSGYPGASDKAIISATTEITIPSGGASVWNLNIGSGATLTLTAASGVDHAQAANALALARGDNAIDGSGSLVLKVSIIFP